MRRNSRNKVNEDIGNKIIKYASIGVAVLTVIVIALLIYSESLDKEVKEGSLSREQLTNIVNKTTENTISTEGTETASTEMGKSVNEAKSELENITNQTGNTTNSVANTTNTITNNIRNSTKTNTSNINSNQTNNTKQNNTLTTATKESKENKVEENTEKQNNNEVKQTNANKELNFIKPVEGDIVKDFAKDNLLYSETLQEWTVHTGVDIKADKTTVVKSAEAGTVKSIKNDPRYGLTIVIEHENNFQTVYSNLLTSEFVVEGEKVEKEQSLGTVGNTAVFESAEEPHLHFEILKDNVQVDPSIYLK